MEKNSFASALMTGDDPNAITRRIIESLTSQLSVAPDLCFLFISQFEPDQVEQIHRMVRKEWPDGILLGCTVESVVGSGQEIEMQPAISAWAAHLPKSLIQPFHLTFANTPDGGIIAGWPDAPSDWPQDATMLLLPEPFTFPTDYMLERLKEDRPDLTVIGGVASGGAAEGQNRLILNESLHSGGCVGVVLSGGVEINTIVSQGCRPIGQTMVVTKAERNVILELGGKPAYDQLVEIYESLPNNEKLLVQQQLHLGIVTSEYRDRFEAGDFLVRNVMGVDPDQKSVVIGNYVRVGQTVQFHVRDESSADTELTQQLQGEITDHGEAAAALMFTCNGRGTRMFSIENHDALAVQTSCGEIPTAGFFAQGEIGPIGHENFVHGYTASIALFRDRNDD